MLRVTHLDHLVLTVRNIAQTVAFYRDILGMEAVEFTPKDGPPRTALRFGSQKINLHEKGAEFLPNATNPTTGSADLCFLSEQPLKDWQTHLNTHAIAIEEGPIARTGALGSIVSLYIRDPDGNLIEISNQGA